MKIQRVYHVDSQLKWFKKLVDIQCPKKPPKECGTGQSSRMACTTAYSRRGMLRHRQGLPNELKRATTSCKKCGTIHATTLNEECTIVQWRYCKARSWFGKLCRTFSTTWTRSACTQSLKMRKSLARPERKNTTIRTTPQGRYFDNTLISATKPNDSNSLAATSKKT